MDQPLAILPRLPRRRDFRIGCIGAGFIMRDCHLVAYRQAGFNPVAIASRDPDRAHVVAERHGIQRVHATYADLLADHRPGILAQKPLAMSYPEAKKCVDLCAETGITLAVNQNMRYDQSVRAL